MEREREKRERLRLGLLAPPKPKVKMSNLMRVLGSQTVADPSALEQKVRAAAAQRVKNHEMRNMARKLTPAERKDKMKKKQERDADEAIWVALFCVGSPDNPKVRFKIDINAQQTMLTGQ